MNLKKLFRKVITFLKTKPPNIVVHFIGIWMVVAIAIYGLLPDNAKHQQGIWPGVIIGFLVSVCVVLIYFRKKAMQDIKAEAGFDNLTPKEKGNRFFKKFKSPRHLIASFISNFIIFTLIGFSSLTDTEKTSDIWLCILYGAVVALGFTITKMLFWKKWHKNHDD